MITQMQNEIDRLRTALQLIADGRCQCGGQFKEDSNYQVRCENCNAHHGYGYGNARTIAEEALKSDIDVVRQ
jgi:hypothetical protein